MIGLILAAGYGTRMRSVHPTMPKTLLPVGGRAVIDYLIDQLIDIPQINRLLLVTNEIYLDQFTRWRAQRGLAERLEIISDGTRNNEERLGAIGDLQFCIEREDIDEELLAAAGDNIFEFRISALVEEFQARRASIIAALKEEDPEKIARTANLRMDETGRIVEFVEKTREPISNLVCPPLYVFERGSLPLIRTYLDEGRMPDAPGNLIAWLHQRRPVYGRLMEAGRHDIGSPESYFQARAALDAQP